MALSSVLDAITEYRRNKEFGSRQAEAMDIFNAQRQAVTEISDTRGFAEIVAFFDREYSAAIDRMLAGGNCPEAAAVASVSRRFRDFVASRAMPLAKMRDGE